MRILTVASFCLGLIACDTSGSSAPIASTPAPSTPSSASTPTHSNERENEVVDACGPGALRGKTCAPSKRDFVSDASVVVTGVDCDGHPFRLETTSDADGEFFFSEVPAGVHTLFAEKGSFEQETDVPISAGHVTDISGAANKLCFASEETRIAVLEGDWDDLGSLVGELGFAFDVYTENADDTSAGTIEELFADPSKLGRYDIVFAACGHATGKLAIEHPEIVPVLRDYVLRGGSLYMSDYAWTLGEAAFPESIEYVNSDDIHSVDDMNVSPQQIPGDTTVSAHIDDPRLAKVLGKTTVDIHFDEGPQIAAESIAADVTEVASANVPLQNGKRLVNAPLAIHYRPALGAGRVIYTNFHNDAQASADMQAILRYLVFML